MARPLATILLLLAAACGEGNPRSACGVAALAGPTMLLSEFATPGQTLGLPPDSLPPRLVARMVAGPAMPAIVGRTDSAWGPFAPVPTSKTTDWPSSRTLYPLMSMAE